MTLHGLKVGTNGGEQCVDVTVQRLDEPGPLQGLVMIVFHRRGRARWKPKKRAGRRRRRDSGPQPAAGGTGAGTPAGPRRGAGHPRRDADLAGGTPVRQRGTAIHQRRTAVHQRGTHHLEGGDAVAERGTADGQHELQAKVDELVAGQQRHEEPARQHGHRHACFWTRISTCGGSPPRRRKSSSSSPATWAGPSPTWPPTCSTRNWPDDAREVLRKLGLRGKTDQRARRPLVHRAHHALPHAGRPD